MTSPGPSMSPERWSRVKDLFHQALDQAAPDRDAFVARMCAADDDVRLQVDRLLNAHAEADGFLETPAAGGGVEPASPVLTGRVIGHYELQGRLGTGGMGEVYEAADTRLKRTVAIKLVPTGNPRAQARLWREAQHASGLNHPNICVVHEIGEAEGLAYIVMERVFGLSLAETIPQGGLSIDTALDYAVQIGAALAHAHELGLIHRDLKSANVMVTPEGRVKVLDFGLARRLADAVAGREPESSSWTAAGAIAGTLSYMAPEVLRGQSGDARSDVWAMGIVLHEMLARERPFAGQTSFELSSAILSAPPRPLRSGVPAALRVVIQRCLEKEPANRYASGRELHSALEDARLALRQRRLRSPLARPRVLVPVLLILAAAAGGTAWLRVRSGRARWARDTAQPEIARLYALGKYEEAYRLGLQAQKYIPEDTAFQRVMREISVPMSVRTSPPGAEVFMKSYLAGDDTWESLGRSPVNHRVPYAFFRFRVSKEGFDTVEGAFYPAGMDGIQFTLDPPTAHPGMVRVPGGPARIGTASADLGEFWLDKYEVTNKEFKRFVDAEGYQKREYWKGPLVMNGRELKWEEAVAKFRDMTGRPGPSTWKLGAYPDGQQDFPVSGVSWYEATAYAQFVGKSLPTIYHWYRAAGGLVFPDILFESNFGDEGPAPVGRYKGITPYGLYDMAGNVKEWCWNAAGGRRYVLGGAWGEPKYTFLKADAQSPFDRVATYGFRCARYAAPLAAALTDPIEIRYRDYAREKPVGDDVFQSFRSIYAYDRTELNAVVESVLETEHWRRERVTFDAAYGNERMAAYVFLPRNVPPPYQTVIWFPGANALFMDSSADLGLMFYRDFLPRSGRAVVLPIYKGTYERRVRSGAGGPNAARDQVIQRSKDLGRTIDYLETRRDIDSSRVAFYGFSWGAEEGVILTAIEGRLKAAILVSGALSTSVEIPEVDPFNFAPRVTLPVLLLNGRNDFGSPKKSSQDPLLRVLGTPDKDKRHVVFDTGHIPPAIEVIKEVLDWLDRYLGRVPTRDAGS